MAKFGFSLTGPRRNPTEDERANGFPCGAADQTLFNGLHFRTEAELSDLLTYAGLTPTDTDMTQVRQAVLALIAAATGGGEAEDYLLLSQARLRLPIFPEMLTADGRMNITSPANGTIRIPGGITFLHRGIFPVTTVQTDFATVSSRTYHLRWNPTDGFTLENVGDNAYNPDGLADGNVFFDTTFDDMLVARVVTNSSNVPTITPLANKDRMEVEGVTNNTNPFTISPSDSSATVAFDLVTLNWARRPRFRSVLPLVGATQTGSGGGLDGYANRLNTLTLDRYKANANISSDFGNGNTAGHYAAANWSFAV